MKNILFVVKGLGRGGAENIVLTSVKHGDRSRFRYDVAYLLPWKDALVGELERTGTAVTCLDGSKGPGWALRLRRLIRDRQIDLLHVHSPYPATVARIVTDTDTPIVYTEHNVWQRYHQLTYWGNLLTYPRTAHVFAVSEHVRSSIRVPPLLKWRSMPPLEVLYHGPDPEVFLHHWSADGIRAELGIPEDSYVVGSVANLKAHKGYDHLLRAADEVRRQLPNVRFVLIGQGPLERELRLLASKLDLDGAVMFTGYREDAVRVASVFDVFVLSSIHEGLSIALIEAMALGKPAIVTDVGGLPEVVEDGRQGFVVPPADPRALSNRIVQVLRDENLRRQFGIEAQKRAQAFQIGNAVRRIEEVYEELLS